MKALQNTAEVIMIERRIPFSPPDISDLEIQEVVQTLNSGWITTGPKTKQLEKFQRKRLKKLMNF